MRCHLVSGQNECWRSCFKELFVGSSPLMEKWCKLFQRLYGKKNLAHMQVGLKQFSSQRTCDRPMFRNHHKNLEGKKNEKKWYKRWKCGDRLYRFGFFKGYFYTGVQEFLIIALFLHPTEITGNEMSTGKKIHKAQTLRCLPLKIVQQRTPPPSRRLQNLNPREFS